MVKEYNPRSGAYRIFRSSDKAIQMDCFHHVKAEGDHVTIDGAGGILYIQPSANIDQLSSGASPIVTSVTIDGIRRIIGMNSKQLDIRHDAVNIEIQFSTLNYLHADKVSYAYRLSSIDTQWHYLPQGVNKATFVLLPKGNYTLELMATDEYGCWGQSVHALQLHRLPAWYESWLAYLLYLLTAVLLMGSFARYYLKRQKEKQQHQMDVQLTEMKLRFFTNISHELRTPLTLILTPLESMVRKIDRWQQEDQEETHLTFISSQLMMIQRNAQRLLSLVNNLLDFRKLEMGQQKLELTNGDIFEFVRTVCETFRPISTEKGIGLGYAIPNEQFYINFDSRKLQHILYNLLSNAFKFTPAGGQIAVSVAKTDTERLSITVKDTGCGIPSRDLPHIFDRYYQSKNTADPSVTGTGIGLHLTKEYLQLHGGNITVNSKLGEGTTFTAFLPTNIKMKEQPLPAEPHQQAEAPETESRKSNLLIVDDNDEFRQFLCGELAEQYNIHQAANGEEALTVIAEQDIDLMVSDVMMPAMDGMTLCRRIKQDVNTSHVMVILLTARTAEESKIEGFRAGADDYLSKPFNMEMLQLRISHLLELRRQRNQDFLKGEDVEVEAVALNEIDQKFLRSAVEAIERHLSNEEYDIDALAADVCMSRSTLYRKLHSLTGQKPSLFIRAIRLKHAARMIKEGSYNLTEISTLCGFSSPSYFSRRFKAQYGIPPGSYCSS
jgi:signal transduction histidine kinase/DNA-binding response OmpR family regulator